MNKISIAVLAAVMVGTTVAPAALAQWGHYRSSYMIDRRQDQIYQMLQRGLNSGRLNQREYNRLLARYNNIAALEARLSRGGLNWREREMLMNRLSNLQAALQRELRDRQTAGGWRGGGGWWY